MSSPASAQARRSGLTLTQQIFLGLAVGIAAGALVSNTHPEWAKYFNPFSQLFLRLIKMIIAPLIFGTLVAGIAGAGHAKAVGRMGLRAMIYFEAVTTIALLIGLVAVNALGDIIDPKSGEILAGARSSDGKRLINTMDQLRQGKYPDPRTSAQNTTIGVIATNAALTKAQAGKIAQMAHDGLARSINPVHTPSDGDTLYCLATGTLSDRPDLTLIGALAAEIVAQSVCRAVLKAKGLPGLPSHQDLMASMRG